MNILKIAFRNLNRQKRRSVLLVIAIVFAFFIVTFIDGMSAGAMKSMEYQLAKVIGGHVYILGAEKPQDRGEDDSANMLLRPESIALAQKTVKEAGIEVLYTTARTTIEGSFIFEGKTLQSRVSGCKFDEEKELHDSIAFKEGSWEGMKKENALLIPEKTAKALDLKLHDIVIFDGKTLQGQLTAAEFQVEGISVDRGAFDQQNLYSNFDFVNKIGLAPEGSINAYGLFLKDGSKQEEAATLLEQTLKQYAPVTDRTLAVQNNPTSPSQDIIAQLERGKWEGTRYAVLSFYDFAPQMVTMVRTVKLISLALLLVLLLITMIGISNTFRMIVHERKGEIGTMRSCGVKRSGIRMLFLGEAGLLSVIGSIAGLFFAVIVMQIIAFIPISTESAFNLFTTNGHFLWILSPLNTAVKFLLTAILAVLAAVQPAASAANMIPAEALRTTK